MSDEKERGGRNRGRRTQEEGGKLYTVEPPNNGHFGDNNFVPCREVVPISEVK